MNGIVAASEEEADAICEFVFALTALVTPVVCVLVLEFTLFVLAVIAEASEEEAVASAVSV